jgi:hypothetical protein
MAAVLPITFAEPDKFPFKKKSTLPVGLFEPLTVAVKVTGPVKATFAALVLTVIVVG